MCVLHVYVVCCMCMLCVCEYGNTIGDRRSIDGSQSPLQTQVARLDDKHLYLLSHVANLLSFLGLC